MFAVGDWQSDAEDSTHKKECPLCRLVPSRIDVLWHYRMSVLSDVYGMFGVRVVCVWERMSG